MVVLYPGINSAAWYYHAVTPLGNLVTHCFIVISMLVSGVSEIASFLEKRIIMAAGCR